MTHESSAPRDSSRRHRTRLLESFLEELLRLRPENVLDVGCGDGDIVRGLTASAVPVTGIESDSDKVKALTAEGLPVVLGDAGCLPFSDDDADWVILRHVLHHLPEIRSALKEATRVARRGVVVAEPCFPETLPAGRVAREIDDWLKREERRRGRCHHANTALAELVEELEFAGLRPDEARVHQPIALRPAGWLDQEVRDVDPALLESETYVDLEARARKDGVSVNGSLIVIAHAMA